MALNHVGGSWVSHDHTFANQTEPNAQLLNAYLSPGSGGSLSVTVGGISFANYDVYVYFCNNWIGHTGSVSVGSSTYYFSTTDAQGGDYGTTDWPLIQATDLNDAHTLAYGGDKMFPALGSDSMGWYPHADYALFSNQTGGSTTITLSRGSLGDVGLAAIEIVPVLSVATPVTVEPGTTSTINLAGYASASFGNLTLEAGSKLVIEGGLNVGGSGYNSPFNVQFGNVTLAGGATIEVDDNGSATGTAVFGAIDGGSAARIITKSGAGTLVLDAPSTESGAKHAGKRYCRHAQGGRRRCLGHVCATERFIGSETRRRRRCTA